MDDSEIVSLLFERRETAVTELTTKYGKLCAHVAGNFLSDPRDIQECVNDAILAVWNSIPPANPISLRAYICKIARNNAINRYKKIKTDRTEEMESTDELREVLSAAGPGPDELVLDNERREMLTAYLNEFLSKQSKENRLLFMRRFWFGDAYETLSAKTGKGEVTLRSRISRMKKQLAAFLKEKGAFDDRE